MVSKVFTKTCSICGKTKTMTTWYQNSVCRSCYNLVVYKNKHGITYTQSTHRKTKDIKNKKWREYSKTTKGQFTTSKGKALRKGLEWSLSFEEYRILRNNSCYYCGGKLPLTSRGLDRINSNLGYSKNNVVPCCQGCNYLKSNTLTKEETKEIVKLLKYLRNKVNIWEE